ncbi:hypothetical protein ACLOJK_030829 [Asimina triloba]
MAISRLLMVSFLLSLVFLKIGADELVEDVIYESDGPDPALELELQQLREKIYVLESTILDRTRELKTKDESILKMEKVIRERSERIAVLQSEIESIQEKGTLDAEELIGKANARARELEIQVELLQSELEAQNTKRDSLEARAFESEKQVRELNLKLEKLQKINDEQKARIQKTERTLKVAEEEMMRAKLEATSKSKELLESSVEKHWDKHGKPILNVAMQKASEKSAKVQEWAAPHVETVKVKFVPVLKERWLTVTTIVEPYVKSATTRTVEIYEASKTTLTPHVVRVREVATPYFQEAKRYSKPYIDLVVTVTKPHVDKARIALKPYTEKGVQVSQKFLESATVYHYQLRARVHKTLEKHELTKTLATKELVWFAASTLKKATKRTRNTHANHAPRRQKRRHAEK